MTLTDRLGDADRQDMLAAAQRWFAPVLERSFVLDRIVLFTETAPNTAFTRIRDFVLSP
jgi:hypothetical protein